MNEHQLVILGGGGHAAVVAESAVRAGWAVVALASAGADAHACPVSGVELIGDPDGAGLDRIAALVAAGARLHAAVGDGAVRERWFARLQSTGLHGTGLRGTCLHGTGIDGTSAFATIIDPAAVVSPSASIGAGSFVGAGAIVQARAVLHECVIVNTRAVVEHDCTVEAFAHIAPGAVLCGSVRVGRRAQVSAGAVVIPVRRIGEGAMVGAGAVVVRDVGANTTVVGVPARAIG